jgi:hypothetical protein
VDRHNSESSRENISREEVAEELSKYDAEDLLVEYRELSEEVRYRDGLMHNSYYLIAIALIFFMGNIISWTEGNFHRLFQIESIALFFSFGGLLLMFISAVMYTYNEKRNRAESRRADIELALNMRKNRVNRHQPPFSIQKYVLRDDLSNHWTKTGGEAQSNPIVSLFEEFVDIDIGQVTVVLFYIGLLTLIGGAIGFLYLV